MFRKVDPSDKTAWWFDPFRSNHQEGHYHDLAMGRYAEHLEHYRHHFTADNMLILDYATMGRDLPELLNRVCDFFDLERFAPDLAARMQDERYWVGEKRPVSEEEDGTLMRLRNYYAPWNARLFYLICDDFGWDAQLVDKI